MMEYRSVDSTAKKSVYNLGQWKVAKKERLRVG